MKVLVTIDQRRCAGAQNCTAVAPGLFELGPAGFSRLIRNPIGADVYLLREAEAGCPNEAIRVEVAADLDDDA